MKRSHSRRSYPRTAQPPATKSFPKKARASSQAALSESDQHLRLSTALFLGNVLALFGNPFFPPDDAPEVAILEVCSIIVLHQDERDASIKRLNVQTLETEDRIFARSNPAASPLFFDAFGELLTVVGGDCGGLITLLGDALDGASYVGRLICPAHPKGPPQSR